MNKRIEELRAQGLISNEEYLIILKKYGIDYDEVSSNASGYSNEHGLLDT